MFINYLLLSILWFLPESKSVALIVTTEDPTGTSSRISLEKLIGSNIGALSLRSMTLIYTVTVPDRDGWPLS